MKRPEGFKSIELSSKPTKTGMSQITESLRLISREIQYIIAGRLPREEQLIRLSTMKDYIDTMIIPAVEKMKDVMTELRSKYKKAKSDIKMYEEGV
ncbi:MAG: hypothetical protein DRN81_04880 [Thermoproteota archaeon]|nr:MAG: hypothetical protein DRN81_04880 [Candidatus Korarchaeota archaeon]